MSVAPLLFFRAVISWDRVQHAVQMCVAKQTELEQMLHEYKMLPEGANTNTGMTGATDSSSKTITLTDAEELQMQVL